MAEVLFYHLTRTPLDVTLPELLEKCRDRDWKVVVRGRTAERLQWLDSKLWAGADTGFLPHGMAGGAHDADQPVLLTTEPGAANAADILMAVDMATIEPGEVTDFTRVCIIFDGGDADALAHARGQWKAMTDAGLPSKYWSQESGKWEVKASKNL